MSLPDVGDLAVCVHVCGCPDSLQYLGVIGRVDDIVHTAFVICRHCNARYMPDAIAVTNDILMMRKWLRKIEPLSSERDESFKEHEVMI